MIGVKYNFSMFTMSGIELRFLVDALWTEMHVIEFPPIIGTSLCVESCLQDRSTL